jgi:hypothetical protein
MTPKARYVATLLEHYRRLPGTLGHVLRDDRRTAAALHERHIGLDIVYQAFVVALARRCGTEAGRLEPIRTLRYFLPVIEEITRDPPDPEYLHYLQSRLPEGGLPPPT